MNWLLPLEWLFSFGVFVRNFCYDHGVFRIRRLPGKTISVGNIAVGGTGKSPIVLDIARQLQESGFKPAILTRGYKSGLRSDEWQVLLNGSVVGGCSRQDVRADEALMQSFCLPHVYVVVGADRYAAARNFLELGGKVAPTHWILDDGFQHRGLARDVDIVVLDVRSPWGHCLPVGLFRERPSSLARAQIVVMTKSTSQMAAAKLKEQVFAINQRCQVYEAEFQQERIKLAWGDPAGTEEQYALVCGVAKPDDVAIGLKKLGLSIGRTFVLSDHESFDLDIIRSERKDFQRVVTTEKDWARDAEKYKLLEMPVFIAPLALRWVGRPLKLSDITL